MPPAEPSEGRRQRAGFREIVDGFRYLALHKVLLVSFLIDIVAMGFGMPRVVFPEMAERTYRDPPGGTRTGPPLRGDPDRDGRRGAPLRLAAPGDAAGRRGDRRDLRLGIGVALFGLTHSLWLAVVFLAVAGAGDLVSSVVVDAADGGD